jgi:hypothetical protein
VSEDLGNIVLYADDVKREKLSPHVSGAFYFNLNHLYCPKAKGEFGGS